MAEKITDETTVTLSEMAVILGLTSRRIRQLVEEGVFQTNERNAYPLAETVQDYIKFVGKGLSDKDVKIEQVRRASEAKFKRARADKAELEIKELRGTMHRAEDVAAMTEDLTFSIRSALSALPGRLAISVTAAKTPAEAAEIIRKEVNTMMLELSKYRYDPERYAERVQQRMSWAGGTDDEE